MAIAVLPPKHARLEFLVSRTRPCQNWGVCFVSRTRAWLTRGWRLCGWDEACQIGRFHVYVTAKHGEFSKEREREGSKE